MENKTKQTEMNFKSGEELRDEGIQKAIDNANEASPSWSEMAFKFLQGFAARNKEFMAEQVREASLEQIPIPPSKRAWGAVIVRAAKCGLITRKGYRKVKNKKAHCTPATLWESNLI